MLSLVLCATALLAAAPQPIRAAHTLTFVNGCEETITPGFKKQGTGATLGDPIAPARTWSTELEDSWESGRFWALTQAAQDPENGAGATLGECSLFPAGSGQSQCNLSLVSGWSASATLTFGSKSKTCNDFGSGECFTIGQEETLPGQSIIDNQEANAPLTFKYFNCQAKSMLLADWQAAGGVAAAPADSTGVTETGSTAVTETDTDSGSQTRTETAASTPSDTPASTPSSAPASSSASSEYRPWTRRARAIR